VEEHLALQQDVEASRDGLRVLLGDRWKRDVGEVACRSREGGR